MFFIDHHLLRLRKQYDVRKK